MKIALMWAAMVLFLGSGPLLAAAAEWEYPVIKGIGGVVPRPKAAMQPQSDQRQYRAVFDIATGSTSEGINQGLAHVARYLNVMASAGVEPENLQLAVAIHGKATPIVLREEAYQRLFQRPNANLSLLEALQEAGVKVYVCAQALAENGYSEEWVAPPAQAALAALVVVTDLQLRGWAYVPYK